ncbi:hypothetical protein [Ferrovibrio sp.]|jgi:hypothetical protein|uniref:hypothetical protein n=1 Tax=Ferrovibrio sp. TaxID=1917215 RepID=UPI0035AE9425
MRKRVTRRHLLLGSAGLAVTGGAAIALAPQAARACTALHEAATEEYTRFARTAALAGSNVMSSLRDMACPCCGEPVVLFDKIAL